MLFGQDEVSSQETLLV